MALATVTAVAITSEQQLAIRRTTNLLHRDQAYLYVLGAEAWARQILQRDKAAVDHLQETWAMRLPALPVEGGHVQGQLHDLQSKINLNNLLQQSTNTQSPTSTQLAKLLTFLELPLTLEQVAVDWIDKDENPTIPSGAEDNAYLGQSLAYRTGNHLFVNPSEIRLLAGVDEEIYNTLLPYICTLPTPTLINVNTASALVLQTLGEEISESDVTQLLKTREETPFQTVEDFLTHDALAGRKMTSEISINSEYFLFIGTARIDHGEAQLYSVLQRIGDVVKVIQRSYSHPQANLANF